MGDQRLDGGGPTGAGRRSGVPPRRRRVAESRELATPLAASFLGLLLVHGLGSADAAAAPGAPARSASPKRCRAHADGGQAPAAPARAAADGAWRRRSARVRDGRPT